jgi:hypothetical protein
VCWGDAGFDCGCGGGIGSESLREGRAALVFSDGALLGLFPGDGWRVVVGLDLAARLAWYDAFTTAVLCKPGPGETNSCWSNILKTSGSSNSLGVASVKMRPVFVRFDTSPPTTKASFRLRFEAMVSESPVMRSVMLDPRSPVADTESSRFDDFFALGAVSRDILVSLPHCGGGA